TSSDRSSPSITSTTKRARCRCGSHSSTDGGSKHPVSRLIARKLFIASINPEVTARDYLASNDPAPTIKSDRLLATRKSPRPIALEQLGLGIQSRSKCRIAIVSIQRFGAKRRYFDLICRIAETLRIVLGCFSCPTITCISYCDVSAYIYWPQAFLRM